MTPTTQADGTADIRIDILLHVALSAACGFIEDTNMLYSCCYTGHTTFASQQLSLDARVFCTFLIWALVVRLHSSDITTSHTTLFLVGH